MRQITLRKLIQRRHQLREDLLAQVMGMFGDRLQPVRRGEVEAKEPRERQRQHHDDDADGDHSLPLQFLDAVFEQVVQLARQRFGQVKQTVNGCRRCRKVFLRGQRDLLATEQPLVQHRQETLGLFMGRADSLLNAVA